MDHIKQTLAQSEASPRCLKCRLEFNTRQELFIHKIESPKHFTCPVCIADFRSPSGLRRHFKLSHRPEQHIDCIACGATYKSAAAFIRHIEDEECPESLPMRILLERNRLEHIEKSFRRIKENVAIAPGMDPRATSQDDETSIIDSDTTTALEGWPPLQFTSHSARKTVECAPQPRKVTATATLPAHPDDLIDFEENLVKTDTPTSVRAMNEMRSPEDCFLSVNQVLRQLLPKWNPMKYYDPKQGKSVCECGHVEYNEASFEYHVAKEVRWGNTFRCPSCNKHFGSISALVAHLETTQRDCNINAYEDCAQALSSITGGLVWVDGRLEDGSRRIVACPLDELQFWAAPAASRGLEKYLHGVDL